MFALLQQSPSLTWPEAFASGWAIRSFMRLLNGDKP
jgi:hypothetical protein